MLIVVETSNSVVACCMWHAMLIVDATRPIPLIQQKFSCQQDVSGDCRCCCSSVFTDCPQTNIKGKINGGRKKCLLANSQLITISHRIYMHIGNINLKNNHIFHKRSLMPSTIIKV